MYSCLLCLSSPVHCSARGPILYIPFNWHPGRGLDSLFCNYLLFCNSRCHHFTAEVSPWPPSTTHTPPIEVDITYAPDRQPREASAEVRMHAAQPVHHYICTDDAEFAVHRLRSTVARVRDGPRSCLQSCATARAGARIRHHVHRSATLRRVNGNRQRDLFKMFSA